MSQVYNNIYQAQRKSSDPSDILVSGKDRNLQQSRSGMFGVKNPVPNPVGKNGSSTPLVFNLELLYLVIQQSRYSKIEYSLKNVYVLFF